MEDNLDDLITDFLLGKMDPKTRDHFEQRLANEPELAARVTLERDIAAALDQSSPENQLRANLNRIADQYPSPESLEAAPPPPKRPTTFLLWSLGAVLLILIAWAYRQRSPQNTTQPQPHPELQTPPVENKTPETPQKEEAAPAKPSQPFAAAFKPIPRLESYIGSQRRSGNFQIFLNEPKSDANFQLGSSPLLFRISGKIEGSLPAGTALNLLIFSNKEKDFEAMRTVFSQPIDLKPDRTFLNKKQWAASPGLYYLVIEESQSGEWLLVDKFRVKN